MTEVLKSLFRSTFEVLTFSTTEKSQVLSTNNFGFDAQSSDKIVDIN